MEQTIFERAEFALIHTDVMHTSGQYQDIIRGLMIEATRAQRERAEATEQAYAARDERARRVVELMEQHRDVVLDLREQLTRAQQAHAEWNEKTDWLQDEFNAGTIDAKMLGKHRADGLRELVAGLREQLTQAQQAEQDALQTLFAVSGERQAALDALKQIRTEAWTNKDATESQMVVYWLADATITRLTQGATIPAYKVLHLPSDTSEGGEL